MMDRLAFDRLVAEGFSHIPIARTILADIDTPLSAYCKLATGRWSFLFESVQGGEKWGRYSIIGLPAERCISISGHQVTLFAHGNVEQTFTVDDPLRYIEELQQNRNNAPLAALPVFHGGLVGYFGYDTVRFIEPKLAQSCPPDRLNTPDIMLLVTEEVLVFDNLAGTLTMIVNVPAEAEAYDGACDRLDQLESRLREPLPSLPPIHINRVGTAVIEDSTEKHTSQREFMAGVARVREYILAGDVMQVVPSQRMTVSFDAEPLSLYRALRNVNPSPYMYFLNMGEFHIVGSSPEILVRKEGDEVTVRPIAGTRRRGKTPAEDDVLAEELLADPKEVAEHLMLIDLGRNDIGRVAEPGTVRLTENMVIERYSHVMHIVSNVSGKARPGLSAIDALRAALPAGTLSGAPKVRAMEIIDELEPVKRGIYGGAVGYISWAGNMDTAIAIRTAVIKNQEVHIQAGAGVVADSDPALEWEETLSKARAMMRAIVMCQGIDAKVN